MIAFFGHSFKICHLLPVILVLQGLSSSAQSPSDEMAVRSVIARQAKAWNRGDLEGYMEGYWKNDSLMFAGKTGITYGWQNTLDHYKRGYPDTAAMGRLTFKLLHVNRIAPDYYFVVGKWQLQRSAGELGGFFTLLFRNINGLWYIIVDHTS